MRHPVGKNIGESSNIFLLFFGGGIIQGEFAPQ